MTPLEYDDEMPVRESTGLLLRGRDQTTILVGLLICLTMMVASWAVSVRFGVGLIEPAAQPRQTAEFRIDLNTASGAELELLPGIGPALARRIMVARTEHPFTSPEDVDRRVKGIGAKTIDKMRPYLLPMSEVNVLSPTVRPLVEDSSRGNVAAAASGNATLPKPAFAETTP